ncbi:uncharacterized protein METZ01_LOCUS91638 [marine metagenome]|uniref:Uncharacterized protein n=1 Tax=marine metagenome TaxID=408172 RepID=A0A381VF29_9ZZZZ
MRNLNSQIDPMFDEAIYHVEADNSRRIKKFTIRFTKANQKYSPEHLEALLGSHEKAIREIPRQFLRIEKSARLKYLVPLDEERRCNILDMMTTDVEMLIEKMNRKYRTIFKNQQRLEEFDDRMKSILIIAKQKMHEESKKVSESLGEKLSSSSKIKPEELVKLFGLDESALIDLKAIKPLQIIHEIFEKMPEERNGKVVFEAVQQGILLCSKFGTEVQIDPKDSHTVEARRFRKRSLVSGTLALKDLIDNIYILAQQVNLPVENRNEDIIYKSYHRLKEALKKHKGSEKVIDTLDPFFKMLIIVEKTN